MRYALLAITILFGAVPSAQTLSAEFEVVSIKRVGRDVPLSLSPPANRFRFVGPLSLLLVQAFPSRSAQWQFAGIPDWANSENYEVIASYKPSATTPTSAERNAMLRVMLGDRFRMHTHEEFRELSVYSLVFAREDKRLGKGLQGPLKEDCDAILAADPDNARIAGKPLFRSQPTGLPPLCSTRIQIPHLEGDVTMDGLAAHLQGLLRQPVQNATGLIGYYHIDFTAGVDLRPTASIPAPDAPSPFTALPDQLGLKLERARALVSVLVIDHIERPSEN